MRTTFDLAANAKALHNYVLNALAHNSSCSRVKPWNKNWTQTIEWKRDAIRREARGGRMSHLVTEWLFETCGWARLPVSYLDPRGRVICASHFINALPDGSLLDCTADQFGEGHSVRRLRPADADYGRYRPKFDNVFNPQQVPAAVGEFHWNGESDLDVEVSLRTELDPGWWLVDPSAYLAYLAHQIALGADEYRSWLPSSSP